MNKEEQEMITHKMQLYLNGQGYRDKDGFSLKTDGKYGEKTKGVYEQYKKDNKNDYEEVSKNIIQTLSFNERDNSSKTNDIENIVVATNSKITTSVPENENKFKNGFPELWEDIKLIANNLAIPIVKPTVPIQREIWKQGAERLLRKKWGYETSAWMLEHSLQDNPEDIKRGDNSRIANLIKNDKGYLKELDKALKNTKENVIDLDLKNIKFKSGDLYYSIHRATIHVKGYKEKDGTWMIYATLSDTYDFTEIMTFMDAEGGFSQNASLGTIANDMAVRGQLAGTINPYKVNVEFFTRRKI